MRELAVLSLALVCAVGGGTAYCLRRSAARDAEATAAAAALAAERASARDQRSAPAPLCGDDAPVDSATSGDGGFAATLDGAPPSREASSPCPACGADRVREVSACLTQDGQKVRVLVEVCAGCGAER